MRGAWYDSLSKWDNFLIHIWEPSARLFSQRVVVFLLPLLQNKNSAFQNNLICLLHPRLSHGILISSICFTTQCVVIKKCLTSKKENTMKMSFEHIFYWIFNYATWHLLTKFQFYIFWTLIIILNIWLVFSVSLSTACLLRTYFFVLL